MNPINYVCIVYMLPPRIFVIVLYSIIEVEGKVIENLEVSALITLSHGLWMDCLFESEVNRRFNQLYKLTFHVTKSGKCHHVVTISLCTCG